MTVRGSKKQFVMQWLATVLLALLFFVCPARSQCDPDQNAYMYLHPAFSGKNWAQTAYDSILVIPSDVMCNLKPVLFDICGVADSAAGVFIAQDKKMYMVKTSYTCDGGCMPCMLEYLDPVQIGLNGISVAPASPLYLPKNNALYGGSVVKVLFSTASNQVLALSISVSNQSIVKRDTLKLSAFAAGQTIVRIQGDYDTTTKKDLGVWVLGSQGLIRYFTLTNDVWGNEVKRDLAIQDTVYCVGSGYAGTSSGTIYKRNAGGAFVLDSKPVASAITNIYAKGAVGKNGTILEFSGGTWLDRHFGNADYWYGNFVNRWDGAGVELLDSAWQKTGRTYRDFPSSIASTLPFTYVNNMTDTFTTFTGQTVTVTMADPDKSYTDFRLSVSTGGSNIDLKNDGKYTILNIPGSTLCPRDSIRLKSGTIVLALSSNQVQVSAQCMRGQYIPLCQSYSWMDYQFSASHSWLKGDSIMFVTGTNRLRIINNAGAVTVAGKGNYNPDAGLVSCRLAGRSLVFSIRQGTGKKLDRIVLYNVKGQILESIPVEKLQRVTMSMPAVPGIIYARYLFSDGSTSGRNIVLIR
jgi:hypothetical protein